MFNKLFEHRNLSRDVLGLALFALGAISILTLLGINAGGLMLLWANFLRGAVGIGGFAIALGLMALAAPIWLGSSFKASKGLFLQIIGMEIAFAAFLALIHTIFAGADEAAFAQARTGGGAVGWALAHGMWALTGSREGILGAVAGLVWLVIFLLGLRMALGPMLRFNWRASAPKPMMTPAPAQPAPINRPSPRTQPAPPAAKPAPIAPLPAVKIKPAQLAQPVAATTPHEERTVVVAQKPKPEPSPETAKPAAKIKAKQPKLTPALDLPPMTLLKAAAKTGGRASEADAQRMADEIETTLTHFGLLGKVVEIRRGPTVTQYGVEPGYLERGTQNREKIIQKVRDSLNEAIDESVIVEGSMDKTTIVIELPAAIAETKEANIRSLIKASLADSDLHITISDKGKRGTKASYEAVVDEDRREKFKAGHVNALRKVLSSELTERLFDYDIVSAPDSMVERLEITFTAKVADAVQMKDRLEAIAMELGLAGSVQVDKKGGKAVIDWQKQAQKVRVSQIAALRDDFALALQATALRIEAPIPGRGLVGIEVPNANVGTVDLRGLMESDPFKKIAEKSPLAFGIGQDVSGTPHCADLTRMPHLLIAGTTGSGKSVMISAIITCLAMNNRPENLKMVMIDPKMVELSRFAGLPHIIGKPESEMERLPAVLRWVTREMDTRYKKFAEVGARNLSDFNTPRPAEERLPHMVVFIDELADMMMQSPIETEKTICRLAQMARATGIHLVVATQRPSVDVVTGLIKANFPARMSFAVASSTDSRVILDTVGAESLLGRGDMLFLHPEAGVPVRLQGAFVSDKEVQSLVAWWAKQTETEKAALLDDEPQDEEYQANKKPELETPWDMVVAEMATERAMAGNGRGRGGSGGGDAGGDDGDDDLMKRAMEIIQVSGNASTSLLQRKLRIGYPRAARLMEELKEMGYVGSAPHAAGKTRDVNHDGGLETEDGL
ncbi:MAG TPA: DNA translocase FtsK [Thermoflexales bacterium]|nr:DNA translocase FtsK [Thermoflexales bacterium]